MFASVSHGNKIAAIITVVFFAIVPNSHVSTAESSRLGQPATPEEISGWDIDIRPDGKGLPAGRGDAIGGEKLFIQKCASCHGEFAEGVGRYPALSGGLGSLDSHDPVKTVGSYWPYATTVFDYVRRAMPFGHSQSLSDDEVYAMTAYILYSNDIIEDDFVLDRGSLADIAMPNRDGFIKDDRPDVPTGELCMTHCLATAPVIIGRARQIDVTPEDKIPVVAVEEELGAGDPRRGEAVFAQCIACHSIERGENKFGPHLHAMP